MPKIGFVVEVLGNATGATKAFRQSERGAGKLSGKLTGLGRSLGIGLGVGAIVAFGKNSVQAFGESETALASLQTTLANNPKLAGESTKAYEDLAKAIQSKTRADDESVISGAAALGNFDLTGKQIRDVLPLVVDYAQKTGQDVPSAAQTIGKAMLGNARALKAIGINFKSTGDRGKDFAAITDAIRAKVGGFAEKEGKTTTGRLDIMKNRFNDLQEVVGQKMVAAFDFLARNMSIIGPLFAALVAGLTAYKIATIAATITSRIMGTTVATAFGPIGIIVAVVVAAIVGLGFVIYKFRDQILGAFKAIASFFVAIWSSIVAGTTAAWNAIFGVLKGVWGGISAVARAVFNGLKAYFTTIFNIYKAIFTGAWAVIRTVVVGPMKFIVGVITGALNQIRNIWKSVWGGLKGFLGNVWEGIKGFVRGGVNAVIGALNVLLGALDKVVDGIDKALGPFINLPNVPRIPKIQGFATGGIVPGPLGKPQLAVVHGGEEVVPPGRRAARAAVADDRVVRLLERLVALAERSPDVYLDGQKIGDVFERRFGARATAYQRAN